MNQISSVGKYYIAFCLAACSYFCAAASGGWSGLDWGSNAVGTGGHSYSSGPYFGRSSGGFGGGGK